MRQRLSLAIISTAIVFSLVASSAVTVFATDQAEAASTEASSTAESSTSEASSTTEASSTAESSTPSSSTAEASSTPSSSTAEASSTPSSSTAEAVVVDKVSALFYVIKRDKTKNKSSNDPQYYTLLGSGYINKPSQNLTEDSSSIDSAIITNPSFKNIELSGDEEVVWYRMRLNSGNQRWWIMGEIIGTPAPVVTTPEVTTPAASTPEVTTPVVSTPEVTTPVVSTPEVITPVVDKVSALFYVIQRDKTAKKSSNDPQYYTKLALGNINRPAQNLTEDPSAIEAAIINLPSLTNAALAENEKIIWYRMRLNTGNNQWWIMGEIITEVVVEAPVLDPVSAVFYVLKREKTANKSSNDPQYYTLIGRGTLNKPLENLVTDIEKNKASVITAPSFDKVELAETEEISWYRTRLNSGNNQWWIMGEIVAKKDPNALAEIPIAAAPAKTETLDKLIYKIVTTGDASIYDVSKYNYNSGDFHEFWLKVYNGDGRLAVHTYYNLTYLTTLKDKKVQTFQLSVDDPKFKSNYAKVLASVDEIKSMIDDNMSDVEKVLIVHEYIVSHTTYSDKETTGRTAAGPLAYGSANCTGYTQAAMCVLAELGIESELSSSSTMSHQWPLIKLDGNWYHADFTWDQTRSATKGEVGHKFLLSSDALFDTAGTNRHWGWDDEYNTNPPAVSTQYDKWFVKDVVGQMYYARGAWFYIYKGDIVRSLIDGTKREVLVKTAEMGKLKITGLQYGNLNYTADGQSLSIIEDELPPLAKLPNSTAKIWTFFAIIIAIIGSALGFFFYRKRTVVLATENTEQKEESNITH